jgi:hypothetical protein
MTLILQCVAPDGIVSQNVTLVRSDLLLGMRPKLQPIRPIDAVRLFGAQQDRTPFSEDGIAGVLEPWR